MIVKLKVKRIENICFFDLEWGNNQQMSHALPYPLNLDKCYQEWQQSYLNFYQSALRGRVVGKGRIKTSTQDWRSQLVQAEAQLLKTFQHWLRSAELFEIRAQILQLAAQASEPLNLFLSCQDITLERLPWESWEVAAESPLSLDITWVRLPTSVRQNVGVSARQKPRILMILGDDTALDFQGDREAISVLESLVEIEIVSSQDCEDKQDLKQLICDAIAHPQGWDILLFAGHSNETELTGGEFAIAPQTSLSLSEIKPYLQKAQAKGLQFALFNSCSGLSIAKTLIDLGLSQVAIFREPIHNKVAQVFLSQFLKELAHYKNVQVCLESATQYLATEAKLAYPSAYLIPCLFRHPGSQPFRLIPPQKGKFQKLKAIKPNLIEAILLSAIAGLSLLLPVQDWLLAQRVLMQARYRNITQQIPTQAPPVLLVAIDEESIRKEGIVNPNPINRQYLAQIIEQLNNSGAKAVGIDYLLDRSHAKYDPEGDRALREAVIKSPQTQYIFAAMYDDVSGWLSVHPDIAQSHEVLHGQIHIIQWHVWQLDRKSPQQWKWPFSYLIALSYQLSQDNNNPLQLDGKTDVLTQMRHHVQTHFEEDELSFLSSRMRQNPLTKWSYQFQQMWLEPAIDFSIPPQQVYEEVPAWQVLENRSFNHLPQQAVIIASGGYSEAGVVGRGNDRFPMPPAVNYWLQKERESLSRRRLTGGQIHAYLLHHYLRDRMVIPLPHIWLILVAILLGKTLVLVLHSTLNQPSHRYRLLGLLGISLLLYGAIGLQVYISFAIAFPWLLPSLSFAIAVFPLFTRDPKALI